jgi:putative transposase
MRRHLLHQSRRIEDDRQSDRRLGLEAADRSYTLGAPASYLIHDRDRVWGADFGQRASGLAIKGLRTPIRALRANSIAERWVGTARRECFDHLIPISERHPRCVLAEFVDYYNHDRPHRSLGLQAPFPTPRVPVGPRLRDD